MRSLSKYARFPWDLLLVIVLSLAVVLVVRTISGGMLQMALGLPFLVFVPGYALTAALFPKRDSLSGLERTALSFGLSIAVVPLIGYALNQTEFGIRLEPVLWSIVAFNIVLSSIGLGRRLRAEDPYVPVLPSAVLAVVGRSMRTGSKNDKIISIVLVLAVLFSVTAIAYVVAAPHEGELFTEFFILGEDGSVNDLPSTLSAGSTSRLIIGIGNHENRPVDYSVEVWLVNTTSVNNQTSITVLRYMDTLNVTLEPTPAAPEDEGTVQWEIHYSFSVPTPGTYKLWFVLLKDSPGFVGQRYADYAGSAAEQRFLNNIDDRAVLTTNINLLVT